ncbi:MAG: PmeII family type II restriction endonuclease [Ferruginibacter sp.]
MTKQEKFQILERYKEWFRDAFMIAHKKNTKKLIDISEFNINPFTVFYLAKFFKGDTSPRSVAEVLLYPRILGTSVTTTFGHGMQKFISQILGAYGSTTAGIDIEFTDQVDGRKKYCQLKSGPNSLNNADVTTIDNDFQAIRNLARTNNLNLQYGDLIFGLLYGEREELNSFIKLLESRDITVIVGKEFWNHFTGDEDFYEALFAASAEVAKEADFAPFLEDIINKLAVEVEKKYKDYYDQNFDEIVDTE